MHAYLFHNPLKPLKFPKKPLHTTGYPLNYPRILRVVWSNNEVDEYKFSIGLEAWTDSLHGREKALSCSHGGIIHAILGASIS